MGGGKGGSSGTNTITTPPATLSPAGTALENQLFANLTNNLSANQNLATAQTKDLIPTSGFGSINTQAGMPSPAQAQTAQNLANAPSPTANSFLPSFMQGGVGQAFGSGGNQSFGSLGGGAATSFGYGGVPGLGQLIGPTGGAFGTGGATAQGSGLGQSYGLSGGSMMGYNPNNPVAQQAQQMPGSPGASPPKPA